MTTIETTLVIILTSLLSLFFLLWIVATVLIIKVLNSIRRVAARAEEVVDSVEAAAEVIKDASGKFAILKILKNIIDMTQQSKK